MKVQVRQGVFETNSSSTHAISIAGWDNSIKIPKTVNFGLSHEFGWEEEVYNATDIKASYLWISVCTQYGDADKEDKLLEIKQKFIEILTNAGVENINFETSGYRKFSWSDVESMDFNGYIDHVGDLYGWAEDMIKEPEILLSYLFNDRSIVETGNDNSDYSPEFRSDAVYSIWKGN